MNIDQPLQPSQTMLDLDDALTQLRTRSDDEACCSFCGKRRSEVNVLVPGPNSVNICDQCVGQATALIEQRS